MIKITDDQGNDVELTDLESLKTIANILQSLVNEISEVAVMHNTLLDDINNCKTALINMQGTASLSLLRNFNTQTEQLRNVLGLVDVAQGLRISLNNVIKTKTREHTKYH